MDGMLILAISIVIILFVIFTPIIIVNNYKYKNELKKAAALREDEEAKNKNFEMSVRTENFVPDRILHFYHNHFAVDTFNKKFYIGPDDYSKGLYIDWKNFISYDVYEDGQQVVSSSTGNAAAGAILFGVAGAVVGATMKKQQNISNIMQIRLTINDVLNPLITITVFSIPAIKNGIFYTAAMNFVKEIAATLDVIRKQNL